MAIRAGEIITDTVYVEDLAGDPSTLDPAAVFSAASAYDPNGLAIAVTIGAGGTAGLYTVTFPTTVGLHGTYTFLGTAFETGDEYAASYDVDPAVQYTGLVGTTLGEFRAELGDTLGDHLRTTATSNSAAGIWIDANELTDSENADMSSQLRVLSAANLANVGVIRRVRASSGISNSLTLEELPATVTIGDVADLYNRGGHGFRPQYYDQQIRMAVGMSYPSALLNISLEGGDVWDSDVPYVVLPDDFVAVYKIQFNDGDYLRDVRPAGRQHGEFGSGWYVDKPSRTLYVDGPWLDVMEGTTYTIFGYARHSPPTLDDDIIALAKTWLLYRAASLMAGNRVADARWNNWAIEWGRLEQAERPNIFTPRMPNTVFLT